MKLGRNPADVSEHVEYEQGSTICTQYWFSVEFVWKKFLVKSSFKSTFWVRSISGTENHVGLCRPTCTGIDSMEQY